MVQATILLTLDAGSVLFLPDQMPDEVVLKHTDGELIRINRTNSGKWKYQRRDELGLHFYGEERYPTSLLAMAALADSQAFGFRVNGDPINPLAISNSTARPATVELEGLVLGGVVIQDGRHLPFAVFTTEEVYYRVFITEETRDPSFATDAVLEKREGPREDWLEIDRTAPSMAGRLVETVADETEMEAASGTGGEIEEIIAERRVLFKATYSREDDLIRERMGIQDRTAFPPTTPRPRPFSFPG